MEGKSAMENEQPSGAAVESGGKIGLRDARYQSPSQMPRFYTGGRFSPHQGKRREKKRAVWTDRTNFNAILAQNKEPSRGK